MSCLYKMQWNKEREAIGNKRVKESYRSEKDLHVYMYGNEKKKSAPLQSISDEYKVGLRKSKEKVWVKINCNIHDVNEVSPSLVFYKLVLCSLHGGSIHILFIHKKSTLPWKLN